MIAKDTCIHILFNLQKKKNMSVYQKEWNVLQYIHDMYQIKQDTKLKRWLGF